MFDVTKKVSKEELKNSLKQSIEYNECALDYIKNKKNAVEDMHKYNPEDKTVIEELNILNYINITLGHVGKMYEDNLRKLK